MKRLIACLVTLFTITASAQLPPTFIMDAGRLADVKKKYRQQDAATVRLIDSLKKQADGLLKMKPVSVMDKITVPPSGSKHDYQSQAPYFWYDSSKPNGLPYLRRDGERNPEIYKITDHRNLDNASSASRTLALAYFFTGEEKYAGKAADLLRYWFFNEDTKMNPNLEYAQAVPGVNTGRGIGIIESRALTGIADASGLLQGSKLWTDTDMQQLKQWYSQFFDWLLNSKNGKEEHAAKNNHGSWYYVQAIDFALFTGNKEKAKELVEESKKRLDSQLTAEGKWPLELERTNALGYSTFNTRAWFDLATLAEITGTDLWHHKNTNGATLQTALDWLIPYALGEKKWEYKQISPYNKNDIYPLLLKAAEKFKAPSYLERAKTLSKNGDDWMVELLYKN